MQTDVIRNIKIEDFDYPLPDQRIARHPLAQRDACKLLVADSRLAVSHRLFSDLPDILKENKLQPLMVCNETKVINARMEFFKETGARIEIFILEPAHPSDYVLSFAATDKCSWKCLVGNLKKWKSGNLVKELQTPAGSVTLTAALLPHSEADTGTSREIEFSWTGGVSFAEIVEAAGNIPIPPYLKRDSEESDRKDYQTVFSRVSGSVAAPTAGLHFTDALLDRLRSQGVEIAKVTLHVGAGTFQPVKADCIGDHPMHTETVDVPLSVIERIIEAKRTGRPVMAVGTTSVRTLESLPVFGALIAEGSHNVDDPDSMHVDQWLAYSDDVEASDTLTLLERLRDALREAGLDSLRGSTQIMIAPGFKWRIVDRMVTNFHQPQSTLLLLVSSFMQLGDPAPKGWREVYRQALDNGYRFLSYGDACLFERGVTADVDDTSEKQDIVRNEV